MVTVGSMAIEWYADLLSALTEDRRAHSMSAGARAASAVELLPPALRGDLVVAATLHDVGYGHELLGFHPLDGAAFLAGLGFSAVVCHLVAHHTASTFEADMRGISLDSYRPFDVHNCGGLGQAHAVMWWADLTTGPQGQLMTVEERLDDIVERHGPESVVSRSTLSIRELLIAAGQSPVGSIQVPSG